MGGLNFLAINLWQAVDALLGKFWGVGWGAIKLLVDCGIFNAKIGT